MILVLNNKSNFTLSDFMSYETELNKISTTDTLILCPSNVYLGNFKSGHILLGAQNVSKNKMGAHTGEVSAEQLKSLNVKYCLCGHSERRKEERETDQDINTKIKNLLQEDITPILCVGETKKERAKEETIQVLDCELLLALEGLTEAEKEKIIIAYEPIWSIGTNNVPNVEEIDIVLAEIKRILPNNKILYGGSVNEYNVVNLCNSRYVNGFLLGGISLNPSKLKLLLENLNKRLN